MKLNKIMLLSIFFIAVLALGAVSASENNTDNLEIDNSGDLQVNDLAVSADDKAISDDEVSEPKDVEIKIPSQIKAGERFNINVTLPEDANGEVAYGFDDESYADSAYVYPGLNQISTKISEFGKHTLHVKFISDDTTICKDNEISKAYNINDYGIDITADEPWIYDTPNYIQVSLPAYTGKVVVDVNGKKTTYDLEEDTIDFPYTPAKTSTVTVKATYRGDGDKLKAKTVTKVFKLIPNVDSPNEVAFDRPYNVTAYYVDGEKITFQLKDSYDENIIDEKTIVVKDSKAVYALPDNPKLDDNYHLNVIHDNVTIFDEYIKVVPNMVIPYKMYSKKTYTVTVAFPTEYKNKNVEVYLDGQNVFKGKISNAGKCNIKLSNLKVGEDLDLEMRVKDGNDELYTYSKLVYISDNDPSSVDLTANIPTELVKGYDLIVEFEVPFVEVGGNLIAYIDGVEVANETIFENIFLSLDTSKLSMGPHTLLLNYTGDGYFEPKSSSYQFNITPYIVDIPENPYYNNWDGISVYFQKGTTGNMIIYVDGKQVRKYNVGEEYEASDNSEMVISCDFASLNLKLGPHDVRVYYKGNKASIDVVKHINLDYTIRLSGDEEYDYGAENYFEVDLPNDATGSLNITIDGKAVEYQRDESEIQIDISKYYGTHTVVVQYSGDSKNNHPLTVNKTFTALSSISFQSGVPYKSNDAVAYLILPEDAKGNLIVEVDGKIYAKKSLKNGIAEVSFTDMNLGTYNVHAYYDGNDYAIEERNWEVIVAGKIVKTAEEVPFNESVDFYLNLPEDVSGTLEVTINGKTYSEKLVKGYAKITVSGFTLDGNDYYAKFIDDDPDSEFDIYDEHYIIATPIIKISNDMVVFGKNIVSVFVPAGFKGSVIYSIDEGDEKSVKITSRQTDFSLSSITAGEHSLWIGIRDHEDIRIFAEDYKVNVTNATTSKLFATSATVYNGFDYNAKVLGVDGKPLKGVKVTFKVGKNKVITKTTNAKGIAALPMKYIPAKYTVVVKYAKQTLKPKVTVKKVISLKSATVKKSAKKLILTATLKKGSTPIKSKVVTFKFNGKNYKAKTNSKGVAKATIKSSVLKKLKVGKKVTYQATYLKEVAKKSVKVKQ